MGFDAIYVGAAGSGTFTQTGGSIGAVIPGGTYQPEPLA